MSYYQNCPFPKPGKTKKKKKQNGVDPNRVCFYTGIKGAQRHEIFHGNGTRQISISEGFQVDLHKAIHKLFHGELEVYWLDELESTEGVNMPELFRNPAEWAKKEVEHWQKYYQKEYENKLVKTGVNPVQARKIWEAMMGRNYI